MALWRKRWQVAPPAPPVLFQRFHDLHPLVVQVLYNRGVTDEADVRAFFDGTGNFHNPFLMCGMQKAVETIRRAVSRRELMVIYGDYDTDGVTATAILMQALEALGGRARAYIPDRLEEGYGLNAEAITALAAAGARLLITVDCGIRSLAEVGQAKELGMAVVLTDHHHVGSVLPPADAVLNPRRADCPYPFKDLAGAGVAFKLAQALLRVNRQAPLPTTQAELDEAALLDLAALGTVADMVPLLGENHALVQQGLAYLNATRRPGLLALMQQAGIKPGTVTSSTIGYILATRLYAAGRIGPSLKAFELLVAPDVAAALPVAQELEALNLERQELTQRAHDTARDMALAVEDDPPLLFAAAPDFPAGILGLVAGRLTDEFYRPAVLVEIGPEFSKGSTRSIPEFHITEALDSVAELLVRHGGHAAAAGFTVRTENLPLLRERLLVSAGAALAGRELTPTLHADAEVPLSLLSWELFNQLSALAPFGYGNPQPLLVSRQVRVTHTRAVGADGRHLKLFVQDENGRSWDAIAFRQGDWIGRLPLVVDLAYQVQRNEWNGRTNLQLNVQDIHPVGEG